MMVAGVLTTFPAWGASGFGHPPGVVARASANSIDRAGRLCQLVEWEVSTIGTWELRSKRAKGDRTNL